MNEMEKTINCKTCFITYPESLINSGLCKTCQKERYNGYTNWETWNVKLWLDNDQGLYTESQNIVYSAIDEYEAVKDLESFVIDCIDNGFIKDHISIHRVNFEEVVKDIQREISEDMEQINE